jgi:hypothetical protein
MLGGNNCRRDLSTGTMPLAWSVFAFAPVQCIPNHDTAWDAHEKANSTKRKIAPENMVWCHNKGGIYTIGNHKELIKTRKLNGSVTETKGTNFPKGLGHPLAFRRYSQLPEFNRLVWIRVTKATSLSLTIWRCTTPSVACYRPNLHFTSQGNVCDFSIIQRATRLRRKGTFPRLATRRLFIRAWEKVAVWIRQAPLSLFDEHQKWRREGGSLSISRFWKEN